MNQKQTTLLSQFSPELRSHIIEFCKEISQIQCDVFLLLARKAACFISVLEDCGLLTLKGTVVSERILDYNTVWLKDKSVVIIDDTVISGTSIHQIVQQLKKVEVKDAKVHVFCINKYWFVAELFNNKNNINYIQKPYLALDHTASLRFCRDIVKALSVYPRPYSTDFPIYESIRITQKQLYEVQTVPGWKMIDTTSSLQYKFDVHTFSLNPGKTFLSDFYKHIGISLQQYTYIKVRVYAQRFKEKAKRDFYLCRLLPLVIFNPISTELLNEIVRGICKAENVDLASVEKELTGNKASLRFIQFYFASYFLQFSIARAEAFFKKTFDYINSSREIELVFPPTLVEIVKKFTYKEKLSLEHHDFKSDFLTTNIENEKQHQAVNPLIVKDILLSEFLNYYYNKELVARRIVKEIKAEAFHDERYIKSINRLNEGKTFGDLKQMLSEKMKVSADRNITISHFLDNAIDSGIIVPVTIEENGFTSRGYRHGEEVIWGENNDKLLAIFYKTFLKATGQNDLGKFWFEKLLVLFIKMGIKTDILEEYNYTTAPPREINLIGVRTYLYGEVSVHYELKPKDETNFNPILDMEVKGYWNSSRLEDIGVLKENADQNYEIDTDGLFNFKNQSSKLPDEPEDLDKRYINDAEEIAEILAEVRNRKLLNNHGLVLLTSCLTLHDCISSTGAEIYIYNQQIEKPINWIRSALSRGTITLNLISSLRDAKRNHAWTAVNSGREKYKDYKHKNGEHLVNQISEELAKIDGFKRRVWEKYWNSEIKTGSVDDPHLADLNDEIGILLIELDITLIYCQEILLDFTKRNGDHKASIDKMTGEIAHLESQRHELDQKAKELEGTQKGQGTLDFANGAILKGLHDQSKALTKQIEDSRKIIKYWNDFNKDNLHRIGEYIKDYKLVKDTPKTINDIFINLSTGSLSSMAIDLLQAELLRVLLQLKDFKPRSSDLLKEFSSLIPQWGKINAPVKYSCLIHVNTEETDKEKRKMLGTIVRNVVSEFEIEEFADKDAATRSLVILRPDQQLTNIGYYIAGKGQFKIDRMGKLALQLLKKCHDLPFDYTIHFFPSVDDKHRVSSYYNKKTGNFDYVADNFTTYFDQMEAQTKQLKNCLLVYENPDIHAAENLFHAEIGRQFTLAKQSYMYTPSQNYPLLQIIMNKKPPVAFKKIGVVTALPKEFAAMKVMLYRFDDKLPKPDPTDSNIYVSGYIRANSGEDINVILAMNTEMGNNNATAVAINMIRSFPEIEDIILSGIAGGAPNPGNAAEHVRLGDIIVSNNAGVIQYDKIKQTDTEIKVRDTTSKPSARLLKIYNYLEAERLAHKTPWRKYIAEGVPLLDGYERPADNTDILTIAGINVPHPADRDREFGQPRVFAAPIGSANILLKDEKKRDYLRDTYGIKAIEMEGSGIADGTWQFSKGYYVVRGIVDYCNSDKNDDWQNYAALCAAAYTRSLIECL